MYYDFIKLNGYKSGDKIYLKVCLSGRRIEKILRNKLVFNANQGLKKSSENPLFGLNPKGR